jgi:hypothetical protein
MEKLAEKNETMRTVDDLKSPAPNPSSAPVLTPRRHPRGYFNRPQLVALASRMEQDLGVSITGTQEQSNVVFGGVTDYVWFPWGLPGRAESGYGRSLRYELIPEKDYPELEQRMAIFHTGHTRASTDVNAVWTKKLASKAWVCAARLLVPPRKLNSKQPLVRRVLRECLFVSQFQQLRCAPVHFRLELPRKVLMQKATRFPRACGHCLLPAHFEN